MVRHPKLARSGTTYCPTNTFAEIPTTLHRRHRSRHRRQSSCRACKKPQKRYTASSTKAATSACSGMVYRDSFLFPLAKSTLLSASPSRASFNKFSSETTGPRSLANEFQPKMESTFRQLDRWCRPVMSDGAQWSPVDRGHVSHIIEHTMVDRRGP